METVPRVDILIPTYNRCQSLERAIDSARSQTYNNFSLLVSDNGSSDSTGQYLRRLGIPHVSHPVNKGAHANFNLLWSSSRANLRLFLADDDWIDVDYLSECVDYALRFSCSQVAGQAIHYVSDRAIGKDALFELLDQAPLKRLRSFGNSVTTSNGLFYGVRKRSNYLFGASNGSDLSDTCFSILNGKAAVIPGTRLHRDFSNWYGEATMAASVNSHSEISLDKQPIQLNSVMLFVGLASVIQVYIPSLIGVLLVCAPHWPLAKRCVSTQCSSWIILRLPKILRILFITLSLNKAARSCSFRQDGSGRCMNCFS
jgi:glycosyltransferase involved in cell wall biosynthesis